MEAATGNQAIFLPGLKPQGQAGAGLSGTEASSGGQGGFKAAASLGSCCLAAKLGQAVPGTPESSLEGGRNLLCL